MYERPFYQVWYGVFILSPKIFWGMGMRSRLISCNAILSLRSACLEIFCLIVLKCTPFSTPSLGVFLPSQLAKDEVVFFPWQLACLSKPILLALWIWDARCSSGSSSHGSVPWTAPVPGTHLTNRHIYASSAWESLPTSSLHCFIALVTWKIFFLWTWYFFLQDNSCWLDSPRECQ